MFDLKSLMKTVYIGMLACTLATRGYSFRIMRPVMRSFSAKKVMQTRRFSADAAIAPATEPYETFMKDVAKVQPPKSMDALLKLITMTGEQQLVDPRERKGLIPFLIPLSRDKETGELLCYIRWPTQKDDMDLQLVRTSDAGVKLISTSTINYCRRLAVELDFEGHPRVQEAVDLVNNQCADDAKYNVGDYLPFLKSGKFPAITKDDHRLILDRYILTKIGPFADCYERLASNFLEANNEVSALVTCERAVSVFYGWGHPIFFHTKLLQKVGRDTEAKDSARAAMGMPKWTLGSTKEELEEVCKAAGYSGSKIVGEMHYFRANDKREKDIEEGVSPIQVTLDQAAHLMDAVSLGVIEGGWDAIRSELAGKYRDGGYPEMATFIEAV